MQVDNGQSLGREVKCECMNECVGEWAVFFPKSGLHGPLHPGGSMALFLSPWAGHQRAGLGCASDLITTSYNNHAPTSLMAGGLEG